MRRILKRCTVIALIMAITCSYSFGNKVSDSYATTVDEVKDKISDLEKEKAEIQKEIEGLQKETGDIAAYIEKLDNKLASLSSKIDDLSDQVTKTKQDLTKNKKELGNAETDLKEQYEVMRARIQYMYENGSDDYYSLLLEADSMSDLLNRAEYVSKISKYDQNLYGNYSGTVTLISNKQKEIQANLSTLNTLQQKLELEKQTVNTLVETKKKQLEAYNKKIAEQKTQASSKQEEIDDQSELVEQILEAARKKAEEEARKKAEEEARKKAEEEAKRQEEEKKNNGTTGSKPSTGTSNNSGSSGTTGGSTQTNTSSSLRWPLNISGYITSRFGPRTSPTAGASSFHKGVDIGIATGTTVVAAGSGTVAAAGYQYQMGNYVMINHGNGLFTVYMHNSRLKVSTGDSVSKGQTIALSGSTGVSTGPHLHFGVQKNGTYVDPLGYVRQP